MTKRLRLEAKRSCNWCQEDTELLCKLILEHGKQGILNKQTNAPTNELKRTEWANITAYFNSNPSITSQRDTSAIQNRFKKVLQFLKGNSSDASRNATPSGGRSANRSTDLKLEMTEQILELLKVYGHLLTGEEFIDCDVLKAAENDEESDDEGTFSRMRLELLREESERLREDHRSKMDFRKQEKKQSKELHDIKMQYWREAILQRREPSLTALIQARETSPSILIQPRETSPSALSETLKFEYDSS